MFRSLALGYCFAAGTLTLIATPASAQDTYEQYRRQLGDAQRLGIQRYEDWSRQRDERYREWRAPPPPAAPSAAATSASQREFEFRDPTVAPGNYSIRLPLGLGNVRVNVPQPAQPPAPGWNSRVYGDVYTLAQRMKTNLRDIHAELYHLGQTQLQADAAKIYQQCAEIESAAAARRPDKELQKQFHDFDELWHPFSYRASRDPALSVNLRQRVAAVNQAEDSLHQLLTIAPAVPYDRVLVAALTHQLASTTEHLLADLKLESPREYGMRAIQSSAQRVKDQANDLAAAVEQNAPYASVVEEYEEFDRAWHRLTERASGSADIDAHLQRVTRQVRRIDRQLYDALLVSAPLANEKQQAMRLTAAVAKTADHLVRDLAADVRRGNRPELINDSEAFAAAARTLHQDQLGDTDGHTREDAWRQFFAAWNRLNGRLNNLSGERFEHARDMAEDLQTDMKRLADYFQRGQARRG